MLEKINVYEELAWDLEVICHLPREIADVVVDFLQTENLLDYDNLKEYYIEED